MNRLLSCTVDLAVEFGSLEQRVTPVDGEGALRRARYVSVFGKQPDGAWKCIRYLAQG